MLWFKYFFYILGKPTKPHTTTNISLAGTYIITVRAKIITVRAGGIGRTFCGRGQDLVRIPSRAGGNGEKKSPSVYPLNSVIFMLGSLWFLFC